MTDDAPDEDTSPDEDTPPNKDTPPNEGASLDDTEPDDNASTDEASSDEDASSDQDVSTDEGASSGETSNDDAEQPRPPPSLIVRPRHPDQPVTHIIGDLDPGTARTLSAQVTIGITAAGRTAVHESIAEPPPPPRRRTVIPPLPALRHGPHPTRIDTRPSDERDDERND
ncbi:MAG: hypothetical protein AAGF11_31215 [Myxococcota bacterium]